MPSKQIAQPFPMAPGDKVDLYVDWTAWLPEGADVSDFDVMPPAGMTLVEKSRSGAVVKGIVSLDAAVPLYTSLALDFKLVTNQAPPLTSVRTIQIVVRARAAG